jgi:transposase
MLLKDFPPWPTVYWWSRRFVRLLLFRTIHDVALMMDRERQGREESPTAGMLDSQTVKAPSAKARGSTTPARRSSGASGAATACHAWPSFHSGPCASPQRLCCGGMARLALRQVRAVPSSSRPLT